MVQPRLGRRRRRLPADEEPAGDREAARRTRHPLRRRRCAGVAAALSLAAAGGRDVGLRGDPGAGVRWQVSSCGSGLLFICRPKLALTGVGQPGGRAGV